MLRQFCRGASFAPAPFNSNAIGRSKHDDQDGATRLHLQRGDHHGDVQQRLFTNSTIDLDAVGERDDAVDAGTNSNTNADTIAHTRAAE